MYGTAKRIILVSVRDEDDVCRKVKLPVVLFPRLKRNLFFSVATAQKDVKNVITKNGPHLNIGSFSVQLSRSDVLNHLDLVIAKESKRTEPPLCAVFG